MQQKLPSRIQQLLPRKQIYRLAENSYPANIYRCAAKNYRRVANNYCRTAKNYRRAAKHYLRTAKKITVEAQNNLQLRSKQLTVATQNIYCQAADNYRRAASNYRCSKQFTVTLTLCSLISQKLKPSVCS
jgi:hypothetical protein